MDVPGVLRARDPRARDGPARCEDLDLGELGQQESWREDGREGESHEGLFSVFHIQTSCRERERVREGVLKGRTLRVDC